MGKASTFDPATFEETAVESAMEVRFTPIPEGNYEAFIDKYALRELDKGGVICDVHWNIIDEDLKAKMKLENITVRQGIFLDIEDDVLALGPNKNIKLGRLREALGQNQTGQPWTLTQLNGAGPVIISVTKRPDKNDPTIVYNDVGRITAVG